MERTEAEPQGVGDQPRARVARFLLPARRRPRPYSYDVGRRLSPAARATPHVWLLLTLYAAATDLAAI